MIIHEPHVLRSACAAEQCWIPGHFATHHAAEATSGVPTVLKEHGSWETINPVKTDSL